MDEIIEMGSVLIALRKGTEEEEWSGIIGAHTSGSSSTLETMSPENVAKLLAFLKEEFGVDYESLVSFHKQYRVQDDTNVPGSREPSEEGRLVYGSR